VEFRARPAYRLHARVRQHAITESNSRVKLSWVPTRPARCFLGRIPDTKCAGSAPPAELRSTGPLTASGTPGSHGRKRLS